MPLHPTAAKMIADAKASGRPNAHLLPVDEARANFEKDFGELPRPDIAVIKDFEIEVDGGTIPARLYRPVAGGDPLALVVYFHGGGWLLGSVDSHDGTARRLALASGAAVLSAGYRRGPESRFPVAVNDAVAAVRWAAAHAGELGADASRLASALSQSRWVHSFHRSGWLPLPATTVGRIGRSKRQYRGHCLAKTTWQL